LAKQGEVTLEVAKNQFPDRLQKGSFGVLAPVAAIQLPNGELSPRYSRKEEHLIQLSDARIAICNQWGVGNIEAFIDHAKKTLGYGIEVV